MPKTIVDRKAIYIPDPSKWSWDVLSEETIQARLDAARETEDRLQRWLSDLGVEKERKRRELWARLETAKAVEYTRSGGHRPAGLTEIEALGAEQRFLSKKLSAVRAAIESIERRRVKVVK